MANVKLSKDELELVTNAGLILTKNRIIGKVYELFGELSIEYKRISVSLPADVLSVPPKISKGENYRGLPWVMLDYPRSFSRTAVFAVRSFFWWGNFFSITLQLHEQYKQRYQDALAQHLNGLPGEWMICTGSDPWHHHFEKDNYVSYSKDIDLPRLPFLKLAKKIPLQQWDDSFSFFSGAFEQITRVLST